MFTIAAKEGSMADFRLMIPLAATVLIACAPAFAENVAHEGLQAMSEAQRKDALARLLRESGENCPVASRTFYQGSDSNGNAFWNVACLGGKNWSIQIANDKNGSTRLLSCDMLAAVNGGVCFKKF